jgi:hypothetical protein
MPSFLNSIKNIFTTIRNQVSKSVEDAKKNADKLNKKAKKVENPLSKKQELQITSGPGKKAKVSSSLGSSKFNFSGGNKSKPSAQPWLTIILMLLSIPLFSKISSFIVPYINQLAFPKLDY